MGYKFKVEGTWYSVTEEGEYSWPCSRDENRTVHLHTDDMLSICDDGTFNKIMGLGLVNIIIPPEKLITHENEPRNMVML